jgi:hypothetical protein
VLSCLTVVFRPRRLQAIQRDTDKFDRLMAIVCETSGNFLGWKIVENQKRHFLTVLLPENTDTPKKLARIFSRLYNQETIEWE